MKEKEREDFPGQEKGIIKIFIKNSVEEESVQLRFELDSEERNSNT
ncbi:hypothetical protein [Peribacillus sp. NPDC058075]